MRHVPVVATLRDAYLFTFTRLGDIIGLIWVPMVLITVAQFFTFHRYYNGFIDAATASNPALLGASLLTMLGYLAAALLLYAMMTVAVTQLATGARAEGALVHFAFGPLEWRGFRAFLGLAGITTAIAFLALTVVEGARLAPLAGGGLLALVLIGGFLFLGPRLVLLLPALVVNETTPILRRAWALSRGNHLRLLAVLLGIVIPPFSLALAAEAWIGAQGPMLTSTGASLGDQVAFAVRARDVLPLSCGLSFMISPLLVGLFCGASVAVWRVVKDEPRTEIIA